MSNAQELELIELAEIVAAYYKALIMRNIPSEMAATLVRDWQAAYIKDEADRIARERRKVPFRFTIPNGDEQ